MIKFYQYQNCTTCKKASKFLTEHGVSFEPIDIVQLTPTKEEFRDIVDRTGIEIKKLFNTHGAKYRELNLKDKLSTLSDEEKLELLASDGMLVKRPLAILGDKITVGFNEQTYRDTWL
ncbi:arsenate reductase family protein [Staphylococcus chromogenes]|uniref:Arsenate reductase family protein n=1 Tax=Staphylococcus chromogenes TaxID=46126 RepID=A0AAX0ZGK8_STACR|nr:MULTISPECIES: arsenate reductase family protein [Staphylococcus]KDP13794.1 arsenate reductase [Staphylococcus chromogenes MU 970]MBV5137576.1 arsenate reductase family protein [Staphylococcus chromogenes]MBW6089879.1 arsenate reductase family protein [Staphylococcus chromogenes]MCD8904690.1 arsenate reductase family protein [Staphylococcus chromogenes]MCD9059339.1 arsenate reductase family protein [Staphylococcus chromogenes]